MLINKIEELTAVTGLKYSIVLKVLLRKDNTNGTPTYTDLQNKKLFLTKMKLLLKNP